ncbi:hypothetical protein [Serratia ureilytica]|uniref:hypothetical protein n=1 Tax=Serratia ureilytica TaxID=300181 RepID=UPI001D187529|nr:hypothetical protein [Serratia ureilytica]MCC4104354.1 hypothetical protein [Serratia ureilytica]
MSFLKLQQDVAILFYATLGKKADDNALTYFAKQLEKGTYNQSELADLFIRSADGQHRYDNLSTADKVKSLYHNASGISPGTDTVAQWVKQLDNGKSLGQLTQELITQLSDYSGPDKTTLAQQQHIENTITTTLYPAFVLAAEHAPAAADIQGIYYVLGSMIDATAVNYWGSVLAGGHQTAAQIATYFTTVKTYITSLSHEDFVKRIFFKAFGNQASADEVQKYVAGLNVGSETRGEVIMRVITDIRADTQHETAKSHFLAATHVYAPGERPDLHYGETVMSFYLTVAGVSADATALDTFSRLLASGTSSVELLKMLANARQFQGADHYEKIYASLYHENLSPALSQALLLKAGNDKYQASVLVIESFRQGISPFDGAREPHPADVAAYQLSIANSLNYKPFAELSLSTNGVLSGSVNTGSQHPLSPAELAVLTHVFLNVNASVAIDFSHSIKLQEVTLQGNMPTDAIALNSLKNKGFALRLNLDENPYFKMTEKIAFGTERDAVMISDKFDLANAKMDLLFGAGGASLLWNGNGVNHGANRVSTTFTAQNAFDADGVISANLILKDIYLTSTASGDTEGVIKTNINQFQFFPQIDLAGYRGTGNIYLDGKWIATEGANIFDYGVINQTASIYNDSIPTVAHLQQAPHAQKSGDGYYWTGNQGLTLSGFADNVHVINLPVFNTLPFLAINGNAGAQSKLHLELAPVATPTDDLFGPWGVSIGNRAIEHLEAGTLSFTSHFIGQQLPEELRLYANGSKFASVTLAGANAIETIRIGGISKLQVTVKADFGNSLKDIIIEPTFNPGNDVIPHVEADLRMEKGGSGGGEFYKLLSALNDPSAYDSIIGALAGEQLNVQYTNTQTLTIKGNTTLNNLVVANQYAHHNKINFEQSTIDSMVTINTLTPTDTLTVGVRGQQWLFDSEKSGNIALYGSLTQMADINTLFDSLTVADDSTAQDIFAQALSKITHGGSENHLQSVGVVKLATNAYIIIDNNHNKQFDVEDIVFSLGNKDIDEIAANLHYRAPTLELAGTPNQSFMELSLV